MNKIIISFIFLLFLPIHNLHAELKNYSVAIGKVKKYYLEEVTNEGRWPHYIIEIEAQNTIFQCALNLFSRKDIPMLHKIINLNTDSFPHLFVLNDGMYSLPYHHDERASLEGGLDFIRNPEIKKLTFNIPWKKEQLIFNETSVPKFNDLFKEAKRVFVFGEQFLSAKGHPGGIHDIHQNQGNKRGAAYSIMNGIWQDGGVIIELNDGSRFLIMTKFDVQQDLTDIDGYGI
jgi:uncharacterized protein YukJ